MKIRYYSYTNRHEKLWIHSHSEEGPVVVNTWSDTYFILGDSVALILDSITNEIRTCTIVWE